MARELAKNLKAHKITFVSGPELRHRHVGSSEANIRKLFEEAELHQEKYGKASPLHVVILDEFDSIGSRDSDDNTGVTSRMINQLLAKMDGLQELNNILLFGLTNRMDKIDSALLRPGRFEVHLNIALPDEAARREILAIHTKRLVTCGAWPNNPAIDQEIIKLTQGKSGAQIESIVKTALTNALMRDTVNISIGWEDIYLALQELP